MSPSNLACVFGVNLVWPRHGSISLTALTPINIFTEILIEHFHTVFGSRCPPGQVTPWIRRPNTAPYLDPDPHSSSGIVLFIFNFLVGSLTRQTLQSKISSPEDGSWWFWWLSNLLSYAVIRPKFQFLHKKFKAPLVKLLWHWLNTLLLPKGWTSSAKTRFWTFLSEAPPSGPIVTRDIRD